jgi:hypothetical protein
MAAANTNHGIISIDDKELDKNACGRITMWSLNGDVTVEALAKALKDAGSPAIPPEAPTAIVALHRAVDVVAKASKAKTHQIRRGHWAIVNKGAVVTSEDEAPADPVDPNAPTLPAPPDSRPGDRKLVYNVEAIARVEGDNLVVEGEGEALIRAAFDAAKATLAPTDVGNWLCDKLTALGAVPLRDRGGVYFIPRDVVQKWEKIVVALKACSGHVVHKIPALRSADAVEAILAAVTADTRAACDKITGEIADGSVGKRALASREEQTAELLARVERYERLLGQRLDDLRGVMAETGKAIAVAILAADSDAE